MHKQKLKVDKVSRGQIDLSMRWLKLVTNVTPIRMKMISPHLHAEKVLPSLPGSGINVGGWWVGRNIPITLSQYLMP